MATTTKPMKSWKRTLSQLASPPGTQQLYGAALRSSQATTQSLQEASTDQRTLRKVCPECGSPKAQHALTCRNCYSLQRNQALVGLTCACCAKPFLRQPGEHVKSISRHGEGARTFCSRACYVAYKLQHPAEYSTSHGSCEECGTKLVGKEQKKFCSHPCYLAFRAKSRKTASYGAAWLATKSQTAARDQTCVLCGDKKARMEVHHVDHDPKNQDMKNLALLCMPCHKKYHGFVEPVQRMLQGYFRQRTT